MLMESGTHILILMWETSYHHKHLEFKVGDYVRISKYKSVLAKLYIPNLSDKDFVIKKVKNTVPQTYIIEDHIVEKIIGTFYKINYKWQIKQRLELKGY